MTTKAAETTLLDKTEPEPAALAPTQPSAAEFVGMVERLASNPNVDVVKLEKIIELQERILAHNAKAAFESAFARMQPDLPEIDEKGKILVKGVLRSTYAKLEDIQKAIKPVLKTHGFAIRHRTEWPEDKAGIIRIVGILSHEQGHSEESLFEAPADKSDYRTDIQSMGSTVSYGRRYTTLDLLNITTRGQDNDGQGGHPDAPDGFDAWFAVLEGLVTEGPNRLQEAFSKSSTEFKNYTVQHRRDEWAAMKQQALKAGKK